MRPWPRLDTGPGDRLLLAALGALLEAHLPRSGVTNADGSTAHASLTIVALSMVAVESLLASRAVSDGMVVSSSAVLRAALSVCSSPLPPVPTKPDGRWIGRMQL